MNNKKILLAHGSGGKLTHTLIENLFKKYFNNKFLDNLDDSAVIDISDFKFYIDKFKLCFTTDSFVVNPIFFPGGDIGKLSVCGTINDIAVKGAVPLFISCGFIIEEGFLFDDLEKIVNSMKITADESEIKIVTGDTKVVQKGYCDKIYINTSGIGIINRDIELSIDKIEIGDKIIINGTVGDHGISVISARENFKFGNFINSDCAPIHKLIQEIIQSGAKIKFMRDPTRGGLATVLNEIVYNRQFSILINENNIPIKNEVVALCDLLGFDPLYIANEGKVVIVVSPDDTEKILKIMKANILGKDSSIIGEVVSEPKGKVFLKTVSGGTRIIDMLAGDQLPRIC